MDIPSQAGTNGPPSLMGESPPAGWEGGSELAFPLDDVPKDASTKPSRDGELLIIFFKFKSTNQLGRMARFPL